MRKNKKKSEDKYLEELEAKQKAKESSITLANELENQADEETTSTETVNKPKKKRSKYPLYIGLILIITGVTMYFSLYKEFDSIIGNFQRMDIPNFVYACLCFFGVFLINSLIFFLFARRYKKKYYLHQGMAIDCIGNFYNCITPSSSGGQFMQAYTYKKQGISLPNATSCLVMNFIVYQITMILIAIVSVGLKSKEVFTPAYDMTIEIQEAKFTMPFSVVMVLGLLLQLIVIGCLLGMSLSRWFHNLILNKGIGLLAKIRIIKDPDYTRRNLSASLDSFKIELKNLFINPRFLILIFLLHVGCFTLRYMIPFFVNRAVLGAENQLFTYNYSIWDTMLFTSIHKMATELIPIPGSAGIAEAFYYTIFAPAFTPIGDAGEDAGRTVIALTNSAQILWRVITFHAPLLITGIISAFYKAKPSKDEYNKASKDGYTFLTLQMDTMADRRRTYETIHNTKILNKKEFEKYKQRKKNEEEGRK